MTGFRWLSTIISMFLLQGCSSPPPSNSLNDYAWLRLEQLKSDALAVETALKNQSESRLLESVKIRTAEKLKDPESARFRNLRIVDYKGGKLICGEVNAKNSYGGYVGFAPFLATLDYIAIVSDARDESVQRSIDMSLLNVGCPG